MVTTQKVVFVDGAVSMYENIPIQAGIPYLPPGRPGVPGLPYPDLCCCALAGFRI